MREQETSSDDFNGKHVIDVLSEATGRERIHRDWSLAPYTTFRVGGLADFFLEARTEKELVAVRKAASQLNIPVTMLGGGSNVLISDRGVRGLVVRARHGEICCPTADSVRASTGVTLNGLVRWMVRRGISGIETWAGTPGTVGGAVAGNAHFGGRLLSERIRRVGLVEADGHQVEVSVAEMNFGYDKSRIQNTKELILWAEFETAQASPTDLRRAARRSLEFRKSTQPLAEPSAGCVFRNPMMTDTELVSGIPCSAGALIDAAGLKGCAEGMARISERHANFFVTGRNATAADIKVLMERCKETVEQKFNVELVPEISLLGEFD